MSARRRVYRVAKSTTEERIFLVDAESERAARSAVADHPHKPWAGTVIGCEGRKLRRKHIAVLGVIPQLDYSEEEAS